MAINYAVLSTINKPYLKLIVRSTICSNCLVSRFYKNIIARNIGATFSIPNSKEVFKKKKKFKDSEKVCLKKRKICMRPLCPCRFFCIFVGIAKGMNDFICRLCVRSVQTFKFY